MTDIGSQIPQLSGFRLREWRRLSKQKPGFISPDRQDSSQGRLEYDDDAADTDHSAERENKAAMVVFTQDIVDGMTQLSSFRNGLPIERRGLQVLAMPLSIVVSCGYTLKNETSGMRMGHECALILQGFGYMS